MNRDVTYKDSLLFHISTMKILCPIFGIIMIVLGVMEAMDGYYVITGLGVIGLLLMVYITLKVNKINHPVIVGIIKLQKNNPYNSLIAG